MTTRAQLRKAALSLPQTDEGTRPGMRTFSVAGRVFVSLTQDGVAQLHLPEDDVERALARFPTAERFTRGGKPLGLRLPLADVNGMDLNSLVYRSWLSRAPKRLAAQLREAEQGVAPTGPDALPASIGKPATRALLAAGVRTLSDAAARSEEELLALHGVGPRAIRLLKEALAERSS